MADRLLLLAVGRDDIVLQARYAAASALAWSEGEPIELHVYTDRPDAFATLGPRVRVEPVTERRLRAWRGRWDFLFRIKPALVLEALRAAPGRVLLVDADTHWKGPVAEAFARFGGGVAAMHAREYLVSTRDSAQMRRFRRRLARSRFRGAPVEADRWMWNSGAVGLDRSHLPLVQDWLDFVDEVFPTNPKPHVEQFGLSLLLQRAGVEIRALDDLLVHYFADKDRHVAQLPDRLAELDGLAPAEAARRLREARLVPDGPPPPRRSRGLVERVRTSLRERLQVWPRRLRP